ncbi:OmpA/MotB family protein [Altericroceibacterium xinjiangense]|uniref:OmpA/MotB family protein n=1 Tax=Altericroceibacterium xinjiangense TaxID=762261 RepID=UPI000F7F00D0|nr:OmpA family protein [Altericroceibacterium xinjiangense]
MEGVVRRRPPEEGESYFMSMTDMMVGLLLIFIILLVYFALNLQTETEKLTGADNARAQMLEDLQQSLKDRGLQVQIDTTTGVLRLPDDVLFDKGRWELSGPGRTAVGKVAAALVEELPCYTTSPLCPDGQRKEHLIDAMFVEGHTDTDAMAGGMNNYELSVRRAETTFSMLQRLQPRLASFRNGTAGRSGSAPILSLSGYGPDRPVDARATEAAKRKNRRIDLRFLMQTPDAGLDADILRKDGR